MPVKIFCYLSIFLSLVDTVLSLRDGKAEFLKVVFTLIITYFRATLISGIWNYRNISRDLNFAILTSHRF